MSTAHALAELKASPSLPDFIAELQAGYEAEQRQRQRFIEEIDPSTKAEFINGQVVIHSPARLAHLEVTFQTALLLRQYVLKQGLGKVLVEKCLVRCHRNDYEPDICFFQSAKTVEWKVDQMIFPPPDLVVEVLSLSTERNDRTVKFQDYARHGVAEYWIVDADACMIEQYVLAADATEYSLQARLTTGGQLASVVIEGFVVPAAALFDLEENQRALRTLLEVG